MTTNYTERQRAEKLWHDAKFRDDSRQDAARRVDRATQRFWEAAGRPANKVILDFGCGDGWLSVALAKQGNLVFGFDISDALIQRAKQRAAAADVADRVTFQEMAAEDLDYPDESFDLIIGTSILHHTDLAVTLDRIRKVLKTSGTALFMEPLNENIVLRLWRLATPWRRTATERAFTRDDVATVQRVFPATRFTYYCLTSMFATGLLLMIPKSRLLSTVNHRLEDFDEVLLKAFPSLGRLSAVTILEMRK